MLGIDTAETLLGKKEVKDNQELKDFLKKYGEDIAINPAKTAWCAAFINACERSVGNPGSGKINARSFEVYGDTVYNKSKKIGSLKDAQRGDICVFERGSSNWQGHVTYFHSLRDSLSINVLGGNQGDSVSIAPYGLSKLLCIRRFK